MYAKTFKVACELMQTLAFELILSCASNIGSTLHAAPPTPHAAPTNYSNAAHSTHHPYACYPAHSHATPLPCCPTPLMFNPMLSHPILPHSLLSPGG